MKLLFHKAGSVSRQLASGLDLVAFLPHQEPPIHNRGSPTCWDPSLPLQLRASSGQGCPGRAKQGHQATVPKGEPGKEQGACGIWAAADGPEPVWGGVSRMDPGHIRGSSHRAAVAVWGRGEPRASRPGAALSCPAHPGVWPSALAFWAVRPQPRPPWSCIQASAASGAQTPRAISAPELLIFLKRLAALTAMKFFWGRVERGPSQHRGS